MSFRSSLWVSPRNGARSGGVRYWPEVLQYLLHTYGTPAAIREEVKTLQGTTQLINEKGQDFESRINDEIYRCINVHDAIEKSTLLEDGIFSKTRTIVESIRDHEPLPSLNFDRLVKS